ncbi:hypothetical protein [Lacrimispora sp.]|uniref:hypothetical protein n=1 Tax=Lacrimispora sp. TaxID=2719234 RepID=UPI00285F5829|nr:hypothetical protein [Lacrimispora sp.]MDR7810515.1 hypothetical protein [Lacrimispora sp.]
MPFTKINQSFYRYEITYRILNCDKSEEIRTDRLDTDILYNKLNFWNKKRHMRDCERKVISKVIQDGRISRLQILQENFILVSRYICRVN